MKKLIKYGRPVKAATDLDVSKNSIKGTLFERAVKLYRKRHIRNLKINDSSFRQGSREGDLYQYGDLDRLIDLFNAYMDQPEYDSENSDDIVDALVSAIDDAESDVIGMEHAWETESMAEAKRKLDEQYGFRAALSSVDWRDNAQRILDAIYDVSVDSPVALPTRIRIADMERRYKGIVVAPNGKSVTLQGIPYAGLAIYLVDPAGRGDATPDTRKYNKFLRENFERIQDMLPDIDMQMSPKGSITFKIQ